MTLSKNNESVALDVKLCCADSDSAQSIEQSIDGLITLVKFLMAMSEDQQQNQALDTLLNKVEVGRSDSCVNITVNATLTEIEDLIQSSGQTA
jgi:altronate dehydratase